MHMRDLQFYSLFCRVSLPKWSRGSARAPHPGQLLWLQATRAWQSTTATGAAVWTWLQAADSHLTTSLLSMVCLSHILIFLDFGSIVFCGVVLHPLDVRLSPLYTLQCFCLSLHCCAQLHCNVGAKYFTIILQLNEMQLTAKIYTPLPWEKFTIFTTQRNAMK